MTNSAYYWVMNTMTIRFDLLERLDNNLLTKEKRAVGKSRDGPKPTYLNLAANQILQAGKAELYKGGQLSRLNGALKNEKDDRGFRNLLSSPPTDFLVFGNTIHFSKQRELGEKFAAYSIQRYQVKDAGGLAVIFPQRLLNRVVSVHSSQWAKFLWLKKLEKEDEF